MRPVPADFAPPSPWPARLGYGCALALLIVAGWQGALAGEALSGLAAARARTDQDRAALLVAADRARDPGGAAGAPPYAKDALDIARLASFDIGGVLRGLESAQVNGIKVARVDADAPSRKVEVEVEASNASAVAAYVQALNAGNPANPWTLSRIQAGGAGDLATLRAVFP